MIAVSSNTFAAAVAVETFAAWIVGTPPSRSGGFAIVPLGTVQFASVTPQRPVPEELAVSGRLAVAKCPLSTPPTKRWFDVFA